MNKNFNWWLIKIDRFFAWILFFSMISYFITGYGMTKEIISSDLATKIHLEILPLIIIISFVIHTSLAIRIALIRWRIWNLFSKILLIVIYVLFLIYFVYLEIFYRNNKLTNEQFNQKEESASAIDVSQKENNQENQKEENQSSLRIFTLEELAQYNGKNGKPAYVAVDGIVYDVSSVFVEGKHYSHYAGQELTDSFYSRHAKSAITKYPVVGKLK